MTDRSTRAPDVSCGSSGEGRLRRAHACDIISSRPQEATALESAAECHEHYQRRSFGQSAPDRPGRSGALYHRRRMLTERIVQVDILLELVAQDVLSQRPDMAQTLKRRA